MKSLLRNTVYVPILPWKQGERDAFRTIPDSLAPFVTPVFEVPPAGDFDHELGHIISPAEHVLHFGSRLFRSRGRLPVFLDVTQIDDERHRTNGDTHPLTALIERAHLFGAQAWPLATLAMSNEYGAAAKRARELHTSPMALRLTLSDLDTSKIRDHLENTCSTLGCSPEDCLVLIDGRSLHIGDVEDFSNLLVGLINELPFLHQWGQLAFSATSLSDPQKIAVNTHERIRRTELSVYESLVKNPELLRVPVFSDYGVEFKKKLLPLKGVRPTAKMNYSTEEAYLYVKGQSVKKAGYEAIYPVAEKVAKSSEFLGSQYSLGDKHIEQLSKELETPGGAPKWRWATLDHHLTLTTRSVAEKLGLSLERADEPLVDLQEDLFGDEPE